MRTGLFTGADGYQEGGPSLPACLTLASQPGAVFLLSKWYTKSELAVRTAILYCGSLISNAFGPMIAAGIIGGMNNELGIANWRWLFIIVGDST